MTSKLTREELLNIIETDHVQCGEASALARMALAAMDGEPAGYFRRYDPDFECLITQCDKDVQDSFPLYLRAQSEPIEANIARDAQRYRFLRDKDAFGDDDEPGLASWDELIELDMNEFDAAIDARMAHPSVDFFTLDNAIQKHERRRCKDRNCNMPIFGYSVDGLCEDCYTSISQKPAPVVTFYRDGIEAAANYLDQQREAYDSEHGRHVPDTGSFEFGNDAQREYSSTLEELAEGIRALHPNAGNSPVIPDGWIPVSERMPENDVSVLTFDGMYRRVHHAMYGHWQCWEPEKITHWMPLPAAPQEVKGEHRIRDEMDMGARITSHRFKV